MTTTTRKVQIPQTYDIIAWKWMRISGFVLFPLAGFHMLLQAVLVGVHAIDIHYVAQRWSLTGWRVYDFLLLAFAFAHGMNGLRQVLDDFIHADLWRRVMSWALLIVWALISAVGAIAIIGGVRLPSQ